MNGRYGEIMARIIVAIMVAFIGGMAGLPLFGVARWVGLLP